MSFTENIFYRLNNSKIILFVIIILGILLRIIFQIGHIYSDDAYYSYLSYTISKSGFPNNYLGYPVFLLRFGQTGLAALAFSIFGTNETATIIFPFLFSILNIFLTYKLARLITTNISISLLAAFLIAIFPTDVAFATMNFPDLINIFFINLGIYFLLRSYRDKKFLLSLAGGISIFISMQFKENAFYFGFLFLILLIYYFIKEKKINFQLLIALGFTFLNVFIEGFIYLLVHQDFLYRITVTAANYKYSYYDFFPYTAQQFSGSKNFFRNLFDQIFLINLKSIFIRRFYLFIPITGFIQSLINFKKNEFKLLTYWFLGIVILLIGFTTSFTDYKPLDLQRSWYIYPLVMPSVILTAVFLSRFKKIYLMFSLLILFTGSLIMCRAYEDYFQKSILEKLNNFLRTNPERLIATDHFTKYSVDLIRNYSVNSPSVRINNSENLSAGNWILYNRKHIDELKLQGYRFPEFNFNSNKFKLIKSFGDFKIYEITNDQVN